MPDAAEPFRIIPRRTERRGPFPVHQAPPEIAPGPVLAEVAARLARERYERWKAEHE